MRHCNNLGTTVVKALMYTTPYRYLLTYYCTAAQLILPRGCPFDSRLAGHDRPHVLFEHFWTFDFQDYI